MSIRFVTWSKAADAASTDTAAIQGNNLGLAYLVSGTYGAAKYAVKQGLPAIALSSENATVRPFTEISGPEDQANVYAGL